MPTIPATRLARNLGDILGRVRYRGESFVIERNGVAVAQLIPAQPVARGTLADALSAWLSVEADPEFARDLASVNEADTPATNPWD